MSDDVYSDNESTHISTATTTQVTSARAILVSITVNTTAAGTITVIDNTSGSTPVNAILKASVVEATYWYNMAMATGIRIITAAASDITVTWRSA